MRFLILACILITSNYFWAYICLLLTSFVESKVTLVQYKTVFNKFSYWQAMSEMLTRFVFHLLLRERFSLSLSSHPEYKKFERLLHRVQIPRIHKSDSFSIPLCLCPTHFCSIHYVRHSFDSIQCLTVFSILSRTANFTNSNSHMSTHL